ncbi:twin-arginine translocation signal domain-containing protein, partial [Mycobacterium tuberculosis]
MRQGCSRRGFLQVAEAAAATGLFAGCSSPKP